MGHLNKSVLMDKTWVKFCYQYNSHISQVSITLVPVELFLPVLMYRWPTLTPCIPLLTSPQQTVFKRHSLYYQGTAALLHPSENKPQFLCAAAICC